MPKSPLLNPKLDFADQSMNANQELITWFFNHSIGDYHDQIKTMPQEDWLKAGEEKALHLFHLAAEHIPAYTHFLKTHEVDHTKIHTIDDFQFVPTTNKANYISQYPLKDLCWDGRLERNNIISFSSGSTGTPFFWPRHTYEDYEAAFFLEDFLTYYFDIDKKSTLFVNCYSMGIYVAGTYILGASQLLAQKGYPLTVVSPGINYKDTFRLVRELQDSFDQVVLCGYPPFIKDIIDLGPENGIDWSKISLKFFFGSEFFSEEWRENILDKVNAADPFTDSTNLYGTADAAIFGFETPTTIAIKKLLRDHPQINQKIFDSDLTPTFIQFNPLLRYFETVNRELTLTAATGIPLIRYNLKDQGSVLTSTQIDDALSGIDTSIDSLHRQHGLLSRTSNLPYLYLTSRSDGAVSFYAILIFPEYVRTAIESDGLKDFLSGKFSMMVTHDQQQNPQLLIHIELNLHVKSQASLKKEVEKAVIKNLKKHCSEFSFLEKSIGAKSKPQIILHPKGDADYFEIGIKQKWIVK